MGVLQKTIFNIPKMDCPSEETLIRIALEKSDTVKNLNFDFAKHQLSILHEGHAETLLTLLVPLGLGASIQSTSSIDEAEVAEFQINSQNPLEHKVLKQLLLINASMFVVEIVVGLIADSTGLISDSLDMFADAAVYGVSLYAVGKALSLKKKSAKLSGYFQLLLALGALTEVIRRFIYGSDPISTLMIGFGALALIANVTCMYLLARHRKGEVHMRASWIFSTNDVIANAGVIVAGILVSFTSSRIPDLVVGLIIAGVVFSGANRILKLSRA